MNRSEYLANVALGQSRNATPSNVATPRCNSAPVVVQFRTAQGK